MTLKIVTLSKIIQTKKKKEYTVWFQLYRILENRDIKSMVSWDRSTSKLLGVTDVFIILIVVIVSGMS